MTISRGLPSGASNGTFDNARLARAVSRIMMAKFFLGWRRKAGCVTLLLACTFLGAWVRSFASTNDSFTVWTDHSLYSHDGSISWNIYYTDLASPDPLEMFTHPNGSFVGIPAVNWRWEYCGVVGCDYSFGGHRCLQQYWVSFWYFITPLTVLSAWLLLSKSSATEPAARSAPTNGD